MLPSFRLAFGWRCAATELSGSDPRLTPPPAPPLDRTCRDAGCPQVRPASRCLRSIDVSGRARRCAALTALMDEVDQGRRRFRSPAFSTLRRQNLAGTCAGHGFNKDRSGVTPSSDRRDGGWFIRFPRPRWEHVLSEVLDRDDRIARRHDGVDLRKNRVSLDIAGMDFRCGLAVTGGLFHSDTACGLWPPWRSRA